MKILALMLLLVAAGVQAQERPFFQMEPAAKRKLVEKAVALKVGDSFQMVTNALGAPGADRRFLRKEGADRVAVRSLLYNVVTWKQDAPGGFRDELIEVTLDTANRVRTVRFNVTLE